jgi:ankyrin repeat protein
MVSLTVSFSAAGSDLIEAIESGNIDRVEELLTSAPENIDKKDEAGLAPLHVAVNSNQLEVAEYLLKNGADTETRNQYGRTPLMCVAFMNGNVKMASLLIKHGADVNAADVQGAKPLNIAAWRGYGGLVDLLLVSGADVETSGFNSRMLLSFSLEKGFVRLFSALIANGLELPTAGGEGRNLLFSAAQGGSMEIVKTLIERGFDIGEADIYGWTPLHYAARGGHALAVQLLIDEGADINALSLSGLSPYNLAHSEDRNQVEKILAARGADTSPQKFPNLNGPYLGQTPPGTKPELFAPDIVSTKDGGHGGITFSSDGTEAYWSAQFYPSDSGHAIPALLTSREDNGRWTIPEFPDFTNGLEYRDNEPFLSMDGKGLYFLSLRPLAPGESLTKKQNVWIVKRDKSGWGEPYPAPGKLNDLNLHWQLSVAESGDLYIQGRGEAGFDIYVSKWADGEYQIPEALDPPINTPGLETCPYIAPDESHLLFSSDGHGYDDLHIYISFKTDNNTWSQPIATGLWGVGALVSHDGRYLFYNGTVNNVEGFYWIDASYLQSLRPDDL